MISYERFSLANGMRVVLHPDDTTPLVTINMLYDVGSRDENPARTGFAHLFEHLMFGGSVGAESFDDPIQNAGGECNAFTNSDVTNFFSILPAANLELGLFLEADRMHRLILNDRSLDTQRKVVTEEFKETCLNQPYGDLWHVLAPLCYRDHSYRWPTIGQDLEHIASASLDDVATFYNRFYGPDNAICVIAGRFDRDEVLRLIDRHFAIIPSRNHPLRTLRNESTQTAPRRLDHSATVPVDSLFMAYHMCSRADENYYATDMLSDILGSGKSSRLYQSIVREARLCSEIDAYITGTIDPGLLVIEAKPANGHSLEQIEEAILAEISTLKASPIGSKELERHKHKIESSIGFSNCSVLNKAMNLAYFELIDDTDLINTELEHNMGIGSDTLQNMANQLLTKENSSTLFYRSEKV